MIPIEHDDGEGSIARARGPSSYRGCREDLDGSRLAARAKVEADWQPGAYAVS